MPKRHSAGSDSSFRLELLAPRNGNGPCSRCALAVGLNKQLAYNQSFSEWHWRIASMGSSVLLQRLCWLAPRVPGGDSTHRFFNSTPHCLLQNVSGATQTGFLTGTGLYPQLPAYLWSPRHSLTDRCICCTIVPPAMGRISVVATVVTSNPNSVLIHRAMQPPPTPIRRISKGGAEEPQQTETSRNIPLHKTSPRQLIFRFACNGNAEARACFRTESGLANHFRGKETALPYETGAASAHCTLRGLGEQDRNKDGANRYSRRESDWNTKHSGRGGANLTGTPSPLNILQKARWRIFRCWSATKLAQWSFARFLACCVGAGALITVSHTLLPRIPAHEILIGEGLSLRE
ncbi:hypothetical protein IQ07DRAFT_604266 [Pyrenochaeta sp. DS3sAY3a]|nr:hypothetical protein IQ07DRAFT_604266 [Pyrenochaeta sp. DS3sAY3a]